jgi:hypothetical protein
MANKYTFVTTDLITGHVIDELPLIGVQFGTVLNGIGSFTGKIPMTTDSNLRKRGLIGACEPARTGLYALQNGLPVWAGIIWTRSYDSQMKQITIGASEVMSYFQHRYITSTIDYQNIEQCAVVRDFFLTFGHITHGSFAGDGNLTLARLSIDNYNYVDLTNTGQLINFHVDYFQFLSLYDAFVQIHDNDNGFDWRVDTFTNTGNESGTSFIPNTEYLNTIRFGYPHIGVPSNKTGYVFEYPGNIINYTWPEDGSTVRTVTYGTGNGSGSSMLVSTVQGSDGSLLGYPELESFASHKQVVQQDILDSKTRQDQLSLQRPNVLATITVKPDLEPYFGTYRVGDAVRVRIDDERFNNDYNNKLDTLFRIVQTNFSLVNDSSPETVTLTLGAVAQ